MGIVLERGRIESLTAPDKKGVVNGIVGERSVSLHGDLVRRIAQGDELILGGALKNDVLNVVAVKNTKRNEMDQVDCTNFILLMGLGAMIAIFCGILGAREASPYAWLNTFNYVAAISGVILVVFSLRRVAHIIKTAGAVDAHKQ